MKRNISKIPEFDEIIFENRNKNYGAYDLRKRYNSVTSLSILIGVFIAASLVISLSFTVKDEITIRTPNTSGPIIISTYDPTVLVLPEPIRVPAGMERAFRNLKPVVTDDTSGLTRYIPTNEDFSKIPDPKVNDTASFSGRQPEPEIPVEVEPQVFVQERPEFPGGDQALLQLIAESTSYPQGALENNIQGKVLLKFVVNADGSVGRIEIVKGVDPFLDKEAIRVIGSLPRFRPGKQNGVAVPVWFMIPVSFRLKTN
jgi:protein TonB